MIKSSPFFGDTPYNDVKKRGTLERPTKAMWVFLGVSFLFFFFNYCYSDIRIITHTSLALIETTLKGQFFNFYDYIKTIQFPPGSDASDIVSFDIWAYLPLAIWNIPNYIFEKVSGVAFETRWYLLLWAKSLLLVPFYYTNKVIRSIVKEIIGDDNASLWACLLFSTSFFVFCGVTGVGQYDIFGILLTLLGIKAYIKKDYRKFIIFFAAATVFKMFALFVFLPLLLLREKRPLQIIKNALFALAPSLLTKIFFAGEMLSEGYKGDPVYFAQMLFEYQLDLSLEAAPLFVIAFFGFLIWCYSLRCEDEERTNYLTLYLPLVSFAIFLIFSDAHPYWSIIIAPYLAMLVPLLPSEKRGNALVMSTAAGAAFLWSSFYIYPWMFNIFQNTSMGLTGALLPLPSDDMKFFTPSALLSEIIGHNLSTLPVGRIFVAVFVLTMALCVYMLYPKKGGVLFAKAGDTGFSKLLAWSRLAVFFAFGVLPWACYIIAFAYLTFLR